jgi:hypothetical protein
MDWLLTIMVFVTIISLSGMALGFVEGRRKHKLELRKEERRLVEARTREIEVQNRRAELEYQAALAELERFDRSTGGDTKPLPAEPGDTALALPDPDSDPTKPVVGPSGPSGPVADSADPVADPADPAAGATAPATEVTQPAAPASGAGDPVGEPPARS